MSGLLSGVRVLDLTNVLAGPFACYQLAVLGAEVIKVEVPGSGDLARQLGADAELNQRHMGASFLAQNAGKRSITLNLKHAAGKAVFLRLVASSDVVVENFRPGVMDRLGLGYAALKEVRPDLVYCAISGFGQDGPLNGNPAYDQIIQGLSGVMSVTGTPENAPLRVGYPVCDTIGGITAAFAIAAALVKRGRSGEGEFIDVSMLEATLVTMGWAVSNWLIAGVHPTPMGNENMTAAPVRRLPDRPRPAQHRRQQAGAVRGAGPARRPAGSHRRSALRRPRGPQGQPLRAEDRARAGAGPPHGRRMVGAAQRGGRAGRRGPFGAGGARAPAGGRARPGQALRRCPGRRARRRRGAGGLSPRRAATREPDTPPPLPGRRHRPHPGRARLRRRRDRDALQAGRRI